VGPSCQGAKYNECGESGKREADWGMTGIFNQGWMGTAELSFFIFFLHGGYKSPPPEFWGGKIAVSDDKRRISNPKQPENSTKLTLFYRFLPVSKKGENGKSPMF
jgi:hypothetical protein